MQKVADIQLTPPTTGKPLLPWAAFGAAVVLVTLLLLGLNSQYLNYFQKPYSFEAQSEPTIEIIDVPIVLDIESEADVRNQIGRAAPTDKDVSTGNPQISNTVLTPAEGVDFSKSSTSQWTQTIAPRAGPVFDLFTTSTGVLYAASSIGIYRLPAGATTWMPVNIAVSIKGNRMPMAEYEGTSYIVATDEIFASTDNGETWKAFCQRPKGQVVGLIVTNETQRNSNQQSERGCPFTRKPLNQRFPTADS